MAISGAPATRVLLGICCVAVMNHKEIKESFRLTKYIGNINFTCQNSV